MKRLALILMIAVAAFGAWLGWYAMTYRTLPPIARFLPPVADNLPSVPLTPTELPGSQGERDGADVQGIDLTLLEKPLAVPPQYAVGALAQPRTVKVPASADIGVFAAGLSKARFMAVSPDWWPAGGGVLYLTESDPGRVLALPDRNGDGVADEVIQVWGSADYPHGIAFHDGSLWIATTRSVVRLADQDGDFVAERSQMVVNNLPAGGNHVSRTITFDDQGRLLVSVGSSCNVCEDDSRRAAVLRFNPDGTGETLFAAGSRNAVGILWRDGQLWGTENGRDRLGDDLPPEEVNILREGRHYGWPYCYADGLADYTFRGTTAGGEGIGQFCPRTERPIVKIQGHTAPLGLRFLDDQKIPEPIRGDLLVALHGSWNRTVPVGHEIIRVAGLPDRPVVSTFVDFLAKGARGFGRPVDVIVGGDGAIYISDDAAGAVYRLKFQ